MAKIDYQKIFEQDAQPRMIVSVKNSTQKISCLEINEAGKTFFKLPQDEDTRENAVLSLPSEITNFFYSRDFLQTLPQRIAISPNCDVLVTSLDQLHNIYELKFIITGYARDMEYERAQEMLNSIFEIIDVAVAVTNNDGKIVKANSAFFRIYGWEKEEIVGQEFYKLIAPKDKARVLKLHEKYINGKGHSTGELGVLHANGTVYDTMATTYTVQFEDGGEKYLITTIIDISMRKRIEKSLRVAKEEAESANRAKSTFLANMSHELRTPLNAIIGFSELIITQAFGNLGNSRYTEYSEDIHSSAEHLLHIINEVLDMSRIESGKLKMANEQTDIAHILRYVGRMVPEIAPNKDVQVSIGFDTLPAVNADQRMLKQAFINIVANTTKHCGDKFDVMIDAEVNTQGDIVIRIGDNGPGIPAEKLPYVLQPFGQVDDAFKASESGGGAGLGLPIAKGMIEQHGGAFRIESQVGRGTVVEMTIPARRVIRPGQDFKNMSSPLVFKAEKASNQA